MSASKAQSRLSSLLSHFSLGSSKPGSIDGLTINGRKIGTPSWHNIHTLSPTFFLPRAAQIEPEAPAIYVSTHHVFKLQTNNCTAQNSQRCHSATNLRRIRFTSQRFRLLPTQDRLQARWDPLHQHTSVPGVHLRHWWCWRSQHSNQLPPESR